VLPNGRTGAWFYRHGIGSRLKECESKKRIAANWGNGETKPEMQNEHSPFKPVW